MTIYKKIIHNSDELDIYLSRKIDRFGTHVVTINKEIKHSLESVCESKNYNLKVKEKSKDEISYFVSKNKH